jgi:hypothetical protein
MRRGTRRGLNRGGSTREGSWPRVREALRCRTP